MSRFQPGERIQIREVWDGRTWEIRQGIIVRDSPDLIALYTPPHSPAQVAVGPDGKRLRLPPDDWELRDASTWDRSVFALHVPGSEHSVLLIRDESWRLLCWYINLESDLVRTAAGFEFVDRFLDVVVEPDMSGWRWKDEEELGEAVRRGLVEPGHAAAFREEGERALEWLMARRPPYDEPWEGWRPPEEWGYERRVAT